jgi:hypothetical protein
MIPLMIAAAALLQPGPAPTIREDYDPRRDEGKLGLGPATIARDDDGATLDLGLYYFFGGTPRRPAEPADAVSINLFSASDSARFRGAEVALACDGERVALARPGYRATREGGRCLESLWADVSVADFRRVARARRVAFRLGDREVPLPEGWRAAMEDYAARLGMAGQYAAPAP